MTGKAAQANADAVAAGQTSGVRTAVVSAVDPLGRGVQVTINGTVVPNSTSYLNCLSSYYPRVGDTVSILRQDASWLVLGATSRTSALSRYTGGATSLAANAWTVLPFGTLAEGPAIVNNGSGVFTLPRGQWTVAFTAITGTATGLVGAIYGLFRDATTTSGLIYGEQISGVVVNQTAGCVSRPIPSDGTTTVCAAIFPSTTNAPSITVLSQLPALVFALVS